MHNVFKLKKQTNMGIIITKHNWVEMELEISISNVQLTNMKQLHNLMSIKVFPTSRRVYHSEVGLSATRDPTQH